MPLGLGGATRLSVETMDDVEWNNNAGALRVAVDQSGVPELGALAMLGFA
jgi:hypothetical protein